MVNLSSQKNNIEKNPDYSNQKHFNARLVSMFFIFILCAFVLFLVTASTSTNEFYKQTGLEQSSYTLSLPSQKGFIYDKNLTPMVNTTKSYVASVVSSQVDKKLLLKYSTLTESEVENLLETKNVFLCPVSSNDFSGDGITILEYYSRYDPENIIAPHIIGYTDVDNKGISGLEKAFDEYLKIDEKSSITYTVNGLGKPFANKPAKINTISATTKGVVTTIDTQIQEICESVGEGLVQKGSIIVMDPYTGELLSVCSFPSYSPLDINASISDSVNSPMINRAFTAVCVGSTFKNVVAATALDSGFSKFLTYECTGNIKVGDDVTISCHNKNGHGVLDMNDAMVNSCNPYFINLGLKLQPADLLEFANNLSFGKTTQLAPNFYSSAGKLPTLQELSSPGAVANFSFGQGKLLATPVQVAQMISSIINNGNTPNATLIKGFSTDGKSITDTTAPTYINAMSEKTASTLKDFLICSVMEHENQNAKPLMTSAGGKTGTAQTGVFVDGVELDNGWFAGFFPAEEPKYTVVVLVENAVSGNNDASPVFREIADKITALLG